MPPQNPPGLTLDQQQQFQNYSTDPYSKTAHLVYLGDPTQLQQNGVLSFSIPQLGADSNIVANMTSLEYGDSTGYTWFGAITSKPGYMSIVQSAGERSAFVQVEGRLFNITPIGGGFSIFQEIDGDFGPSDGCELVVEEGESQGEPEFYPCNEEYNNCPAVIDVLVLVTTDATPWYVANNPSYSQIRLAVETAMRIAIQNSGIPRKKVRISKILPNFNFTYPPVQDCLQLLNNLRQQSNSDRERYRADLVLLITSEDWACGAGAAYVNNNCGSGIYNCYAYVERPYLLHPRWTAVHELGHLLNMHHDGPGLQDNCPHSANLDNLCGHGWKVGGQDNQNTLMQTMSLPTPPGSTRILHFSNPDIFYNGVPTGTATSNNAKIFRNRGCGVENFIATATWDVFISAPDEICVIPESPEPVEMSAHVEQPNTGGQIQPVVPSALPITGKPSYTYEWRYNTTGNFNADPGTLFGTNAAATLLPPASSVLFVQLKVTSGDLQVITIIKRISVAICGRPLSDNAPANNHEVSLRLYPNPTDGSLQIELPNTLSNASWQVQIFDAMGEMRHSTLVQHTGAQRVAKLEVHRLPSGFYTCQAQQNAHVYRAKFLKL